MHGSELNFLVDFQFKESCKKRHARFLAFFFSIECLTFFLTQSYKKKFKLLGKVTARVLGMTSFF